MNFLAKSLPKEFADMFSINTATWMADLPSEVRAKPLGEIVVPGAHNACSQALLPKAYRCSTLLSDKGMRNVAKAMYLPIANGIITEYVLCQKLAIDELLCAGVRFIDARVTFDPDKDRFVVCKFQTYSCLFL